MSSRTKAQRIHFGGPVGFVRNRDIKLKTAEQKKEEHIAKATVEGVCRKCREKLEWKFKYDKYKPLKAIGNCQQCRQKNLTKAYRTWCDPCSLERNACPGCCQTLLESDAPDYVPPTPAEASEAASVEQSASNSGEGGLVVDGEVVDNGVKDALPDTVFSKATATGTGAASIGNTERVLLDGKGVRFEGYKS